MAKFKRLLKKTWEWAKPYFTWKMAPFLLIAWMITNGWSYVFVALGPIIGASWMTWIGGVWISFLWFPLTVEKPITLFIAGLLYRIVYKEKFKHKGEKEKKMNFGEALESLKQGKKLARKGWNGKNMFAYYVSGGKYKAQMDVIKGIFENDLIPYRPYLALKTAQDDIATWCPSVSDILAEDWMLVE